MDIKRLVLGNLKTNCYIISKNGKCLIIDPACDSEYIIKNTKNLKIVGVIVTHYHFDHIGALDYFKNLNINIYDVYNLSFYNSIDDFNFYKIDTKGHHDTCITIYFKEEAVMFTGDFLFFESIGRTDLETGDINIMIKSLEKIRKYPTNIIVYPGHGNITSLNHEFLYNEYFKLISKDN